MKRIELYTLKPIMAKPSDVVPAYHILEKNTQMAVCPRRVYGVRRSEVASRIEQLNPQNNVPHEQCMDYPCNSRCPNFEILIDDANNVMAYINCGSAARTFQISGAKVDVAPAETTLKKV